MNLQIQQEAADWFVEFRTGEPDVTTRKAFDAWIRQSPEHLRAYLEMTEIWQDTPHVSAEAGGDAAALIQEAHAEGNVIPFREVRTAGVEKQPRPIRRPKTRILAAAAWVLVLLSVGAVGWVWRLQDVYATGIGEQRTVTLPDGSTVELNSQSRVRVAFHSHQRDVELLQGQALFHVAHDLTRPFLVHSEGAQVRAVGTEFDVYRKADSTVVTVVEGRVAVIPDPALLTTGASSSIAPINVTSILPSELLLAAGEQLTVSRRASPKPMPVDAAVATSWSQHKIVFKRTPLADAFAELNRYSRRSLRIEGSGLEDFQISGTYATTDPALLITFLRQQPGITVQETDTAIVVSKAK